MVFDYAFSVVSYFSAVGFGCIVNLSTRVATSVSSSLNFKCWTGEPNAEFFACWYDSPSNKLSYSPESNLALLSLPSLIINKPAKNSLSDKFLLGDKFLK
jgi:hypothetical protein